MAVVLYNHLSIEKKWQRNWKKRSVPEKDTHKEMFNCTHQAVVLNPQGILLENWRSFVMTDVVCRYQTMLGKQVSHPIGCWTSSKETVEAARRKGIPVAEESRNEMAEILRQCSLLGITDTEEELFRSKEGKVKETANRLLLKLMEKGLVYRAKRDNGEQVLMLKLTAYADRLYDDLETADYPEPVKKVQREYIRPSESGISMRDRIVCRDWKEDHADTEIPSFFFEAIGSLLDREGEHFERTDLFLADLDRAVLPILTARFLTKVLYDLGEVSFTEPYKKLCCYRPLVMRVNRKMGYSLHKMPSLESYVENYGRDTLRMYSLFLGPPEMGAEWEDTGMDGVYRFLNRFWTFVLTNMDTDTVVSGEMKKVRARMIREVTSHLEKFKVNRLISDLMEGLNQMIALAKTEGIDRETLETAVRLLAPLAPHAAEELFSRMGHTESVFETGWPVTEKEEPENEPIELPVQINGKIKGRICISADASETEVIDAALGILKDGGTVLKTVYVPGKIINIVRK